MNLKSVPKLNAKVYLLILYLKIQVNREEHVFVINFITLIKDKFEVLK